MTKLPVSLFTNYEPGGPLCHILAVAHQMKAEQTWRRFDFVSPARMNRNVELFVNVLKDLQTSKLWEPPVVFFHSSLESDETARLAEIVKRHNVSVGVGCGCGWWVVGVTGGLCAWLVGCGCGWWDVGVVGGLWTWLAGSTNWDPTSVYVLQMTVHWYWYIHPACYTETLLQQDWREVAVLIE